ncbi:MAG: hypothetical protein IOC63_02840 [Methylobacterium sp.]|nr:hypothetical protein [Methylobacterium sp.]
MVNQIFGDDKNNNITGTAARDMIYGRGGDDMLDGGAGNDVLYGGAGNDTLYGGEGDDQLSGESGADIMYGGIGNDTYYVDDIGDRVIENNNEGIDTVVSTISYTLGASVEILRLDGSANINGTGNSLNNTIIGNAGNNILDGGAGNDSINGGAGDDIINGGLGNDWLHGGSGDDVVRLNAGEGAFDVFVNGGEGNDTVAGNGANVLVFDKFGVSDRYVNFELLTNGTRGVAGNGNNNVFDFSGVDVQVPFVDGLGGNDKITASDVTNGVEYRGGIGDDMLIGQGRNDNLQGDDGSDTIYGGGGNDTISGGTQQVAGIFDTINAGEGDDRITLNQRDGEFDIVDGGTGNDTVAGNGGNDLFFDNFGAAGQYMNIEALTNTNGMSTRGAFGNDSANVLNMSGVALTVTKVGGGNGNDTVTTGASHTLRTDYDGGAGTDSIAIKLSAADYSAVAAAGQLAALNAYVAAPTGNVLNLSSLDFTARNFESATLDLALDVLRVASVLGGTNNTVTQPQGGTGNPTSVIQTTPTNNGTDNFAAYLDVNNDGIWNSGEARENLTTFGNGAAMTETDAAGGLVDVTFVGGGVSGNQFFIGVGNGGHVNGTEKIVFTLTDATTAGGGEITIRGPVNGNPHNNPLADIVAGTQFDVFLFNDDNNNGLRDTGEDVGALKFTVASAQQDFTAALFPAAGGATFDGIEIAANTGAFTLDNLEFYLV